MTIQDLVEYGFVDFKDYKNGLYYLEFVYSKDRTFTNMNTPKETYNYLGTIFCDADGNIYKATVKSYCVVELDAKITIGFPQIINKVHNLTLDDIFKVGEDKIPYINLVEIGTTCRLHNSVIWANRIKNHNDIDMIQMYQSNFCIREYIEETQDKIKTQEFFKNEKEKFSLIADSITEGSKRIQAGLENLGAATERGFGNLANVHKYDAGNSYVACGGSSR